MGAAEWIAFGTLLFTIAMGGGAVIVKQANSKNEILAQLQLDKTELGDELNAIRMAAYEEYKTLRSEMQISADIARREFGDTILAIRAKITEVEFWTRDQLQETRHTLYGRLDMTRMELIGKTEKLEERTRQLELFQAHEMGKKTIA